MHTTSGKHYFYVIFWSSFIKSLEVRLHRRYCVSGLSTFTTLHSFAPQKTCELLLGRSDYRIPII
jgi:hypothetical protein